MTDKLLMIGYLLSVLAVMLTIIFGVVASVLEYHRERHDK